MNSSRRRLVAIAAALSAAGLVAPMSAGAASTVTPSVASPPLVITFVPPSVGPITVNVGATIINGNVISSGVNLTMPAISSPAITWTVPAWPH